jgi:periplasmic divalent cation tolerance protein
VTDICEVIITADNPEWLLGFTRSLVTDRLAACGQHVLSIRSIYRWQGAVEDEGEARVALHTRLSLVPAIVERADREHPYDVPCVIALPVAAGNPAYIEWVLSETTDPTVKAADPKSSSAFLNVTLGVVSQEILDSRVPGDA